MWCISRCCSRVNSDVCTFVMMMMIIIMLLVWNTRVLLLSDKVQENRCGDWVYFLGALSMSTLRVNSGIFDVEVGFAEIDSNCRFSEFSSS